MVAWFSCFHWIIYHRVDRLRKANIYLILNTFVRKKEAKSTPPSYPLSQLIWYKPSNAQVKKYHGMCENIGKGSQTMHSFYNCGWLWMLTSQSGAVVSLRMKELCLQESCWARLERCLSVARLSLPLLPTPCLWVLRRLLLPAAYCYLHWRIQVEVDMYKVSDELLV